MRFSIGLLKKMAGFHAIVVSSHKKHLDTEEGNFIAIILFPLFCFRNGNSP
jgi:hypothetical protein